MIKKIMLGLIALWSALFFMDRVLLHVEANKFKKLCISQKKQREVLYKENYFPTILGGSRWIIYDESDQVLLPSYQREKDRRSISQVEAEIEVCLTSPDQIDKHLFVRYFSSECQ